MSAGVATGQLYRISGAPHSHGPSFAAPRAAVRECNVQGRHSLYQPASGRCGNDCRGSTPRWFTGTSGAASLIEDAHRQAALRPRCRRPVGSVLMRSCLAVAQRLLFGLLVLFAGVLATAGYAQDEQPEPAVSAPSDGGWPRQYTADQTTFTVYQPQVESWDQALLTARAAVAVQKAGAATPEYGTIQFTARTLVDKESDLVTLTEI